MFSFRAVPRRAAGFPLAGRPARQDGRHARLRTSPNPSVGVPRVRGGAGTDQLGPDRMMAARMQDFADFGPDRSALSGCPTPRASAA